MVEQKFKRNIAYKFRIGDLLVGKPIMNGEKFSFLELGDKKIVRVNIVGNIVDRYEGQGETDFLSLTIDDGSGQIRIKTFGEDVKKFSDFVQGKTVIVIGNIRHWNNEIYISPEIIRKVDIKYLLLRKLETEKQRSMNAKPLEKNEIIAVKDKILELIKSNEENGGIEKEDINIKLREFSPEIISQEIQKLLEEGIIFEPRPGKIRWLG